MRLPDGAVHEAKVQLATGIGAQFERLHLMVQHARAQVSTAELSRPVKVPTPPFVVVRLQAWSVYFGAAGGEERRG